MDVIDGRCRCEMGESSDAEDVAEGAELAFSASSEI